MKNLSVAVLRLRDFRLLLFARMFSTMALQAQAVIVGWQVYSLTHNTFLLGLTGLAEAIPAIGCALFAGHIVDVSAPQKIFVACMGALALNTIALLLLAGGIVTTPAPWLLTFLFAGVFISGLARSFTMPASFSLLSRLVSRAEMSSASAWLNSGFQISAICGPAVAGIIYGGYGPRGAWLLPALLMSIGFVLISSLRVHHVPNGEKREPALQSIKAGWAFILKNPAVLGTMAVDMFAVLFGGAVAMLPAYADQVLHVGAEGLGALRAAPALGAVIMALFLALKPLKRISTTIMLWCVAGFGFCMIGFGFSTIFWLSMVFLALSGAFDCVSVVIRNTLIQLLTPPAMMGRISSVKAMFVVSSNEIGAFESGSAATVLGLVPSVVFGGFATLIVVAVTALLSPQMRKTVVEADEK